MITRPAALLLAVAASVSGACAQVRAAPAEDVQFANAAPTRGMVFTVTHEGTTTGNVKTNGKDEPMNERLTATVTVEVVEVSGTFIMKKRIKVASAHLKADTMGKQEDGDLPIAGKTYMVDNSLRQPFSTEDGTELTPKERWALRQLPAAGGADAPMSLVSGKSFVKDKKVSTREPLGMLFSLQLTDPVDLSLTMTKADAKTASFAIAVKSASKVLGFQVTSSIKGTVQVDRERASPTELTVVDSQVGRGKVSGELVEMNATIKTHETIEYAAASHL